MGPIRIGIQITVPAAMISFGVIMFAAEDGTTPKTPSGKIAPQAATKANPFINSLGMKLVPVPGTKVLFCVWETRLKDYRAYAQSVTGVNSSWEKPGFAQTEDCPVVNVSWNDAQAFCAWLSKKEGQAYRLPTDLEWNAAVGMGPELETDKTPEVREGRQPGFPWGKKWPPAKKTGNFAASLGVDPFAYTSPVGSFAANVRGIYDLDGNVSEWCEDQFNKERDDRTLRGSDWGQSFEDLLRSDRRGYAPPAKRDAQNGFRCVLVLPAK